MLQLELAPHAPCGGVGFRAVGFVAPHTCRVLQGWQSCPLLIPGFSGWSPRCFSVAPDEWVSISLIFSRKQFWFQ